MWIASGRIGCMHGKGYAWMLRSSFVADTLIHDGGHLLSLASWALVLSIWIASLAHARLAPWRRPLGYLLLATATAAVLVVWMKSWTDMDCPWDILGYGGTRPYHGLFAPRTGPRGACFPAAHASAGYCWMALYFFFMAMRPRLRWFGLGVGLALGLLLGMTQQLRGAHFLSHDLWSVALCWFTALGLYTVTLLGKEVESEPRAASQPSHSIR
jgi:membrane-associated PAP2 superfamily phosphatase